MPYRPMDRSWSTSPPGTRLTSSWAGSRPIPTSRRPSPRLDRVLQAGHGVVGRTTRTVVAMTTMTATAIEVEMPEPWLPAPPELPPVRVDAEAVSSRPRLVTRPLALVLVASMAAILGVCAVRGLGFAVAVVLGGALVASLVPRERRGEGLGLYGLVVGVPSVVALPLGVWLSGHIGYPPVFVAAAIAALAGLVVVPGLPGREPAPDRPVGVLSGLRP